jgi:hypothetical protein
MQLMEESMRPPKELSEIRDSAHEAIDRSRNTRQKTVLLSYVSLITRERSVALRVQGAKVSNSPQDTAAQPEPTKAGEKKPVQSVRTVPSI